MMERIFTRFGADWHQFRTMLALSIRLDFREHRGIGGHHRRLSPIVWSLIFYSIMGFSLAVSLLPKATLFLYSFLILAYSMVMIVFAVILEFGNTLVVPEDTEVLAFRPLSSRTYFLARFFNLLFYVLFMGTALCLIPSLVGMAVQGSRWMFPLIFFPIALVADLASAAFVVVVYTGLLKAMPYERFKDGLAYIQTGFAFFMFFSYQFIPRLSREFIQQGAEVSGAWLYAVPPAWFAAGVQIFFGQNRNPNILLACMAVVATGFLFFFSFRKISLQYAQRIAQLQTTSKKQDKKKASSAPLKGSFQNRTALKLLRNPEAFAGFQLTSSMMKRDRWVKISTYPVLAFPLAFLAAAILEGELADPLSASSFEFFNLSSMVIFFIFFMIYSLLMGVCWANDWEASWIYHVAPLVSPGRFYQGVKWAFLVRLILPFFVLLGVIYCTQILLLHGIQYAFSLFIFGLVAFSVGSFFIREYPFSQKREKGERTRQLTFLLLVLPFFIVTWTIPHWTYRSSAGWWLTQFGMVLLFLYLESLAVKKIDRRLRRKEFFA